ncbi:hypothetical protein ACJX0J_007587, partial [Zea mays]
MCIKNKDTIVRDKCPKPLTNKQKLGNTTLDELTSIPIVAIHALQQHFFDINMSLIVKIEKHNKFINPCGMQLLQYMLLASKSTPEEIPLNVSIGQYGPGYHGPSDKHEEAWKEYGSVDASSEVANANMLADLWAKNMFSTLASIWQRRACLLFSLLQEGVQAENIALLYISWGLSHNKILVGDINSRINKQAKFLGFLYLKCQVFIVKTFVIDANITTSKLNALLNYYMVYPCGMRLLQYMLL